MAPPLYFAGLAVILASMLYHAAPAAAATISCPLVNQSDPTVANCAGVIYNLTDFVASPAARSD